MMFLVVIGSPLNLGMKVPAYLSHILWGYMLIAERLEPAFPLYTYRKEYDRKVRNQQGPHFLEISGGDIKGE